MGELMAEHGFELGLAQGVDQAACHCHAVLALAKARRIGVERGILDDFQRGHGKTPRDAKGLERIVETRRILPRHGCCAGRKIDQRLVEKIGDPEPKKRACENERRPAPEVRSGRAGDRVEIAAILCLVEQRQRKGQDLEQDEKAAEHQDGVEPVLLDVCVKTVGLEHGEPGSAAPLESHLGRLLHRGLLAFIERKEILREKAERS